MDIDIKQGHPFLSYVKNMAEFSKPLQNLDINLFTFMRSYSDNSRIYLSNNQEWIKQYYQLGLYKTSLFESHPRLYKSQIMIWPLPGEDVSEVIKHGQLYYNSHSGITLCENHVQYTDFYFFSFSKPKSHFLNYFINSLDIVKDYSSYFLERVSGDMEVLDKCRIKIPNQDFSATEYKIFIKNNHAIKSQFYKNIGLSNNKQEINKLSDSEKQCFKFLLSGKTSSEIAKLLCISKRTVEKHNENIRNKLKCKNKYELISKFRDLF